MAKTKAEVKKIMAKSIKRIDKIFDQFKVKGMTRKQFRQEFIALGDPNAAARDLEGMKAAQQAQRMSQSVITVN